MTTITPTAATFRDLADLINREELPPATIAVSENNQIISVNTTGTGQPEGDLRRWAQAVGAIVYNRPAELQGCAATYLYAETTIDGVFWTLYAFLPVQALWPDMAHDGMGVGLVVS